MTCSRRNRLGTTAALGVTSGVATTLAGTGDAGWVAGPGGDGGTAEKNDRVCALV